MVDENWLVIALMPLTSWNGLPFTGGYFYNSSISSGPGAYN